MAIFKNFKKTSGFTLIEALIFLFIFSVITLSFYSALSLSARYIIDAKNRLGALSIGREKMEIVRNLPYDDVGTVNGAVSGSLPDDEDVMENTRSYHVRTTVEYVEDDFDGVYPEDTAWEDYKKVTIAVTWTGASPGSEEVRLFSRFVPPGLEVANPGDGILVVNVFSDQPGGSGIPNASLHVVNSETGLNTNVQTDGSGNAVIMGDKVTESIQKYEITVTKLDYETVNTLPPYPDTPYNPVDVHASVITGEINVTNIVQNRLADLQIDTVNYLGDTAIPDIDFHLEGGRKMGNEAADPFDPVYNMDTDTQTNSSGEKDFGSVSPGQFAFTLATSVSSHVLIDTDPISPFSIFSGDDVVVKAKLADKNAASLLVRVMDDDEGVMSPVSEAEVNLSNGSGYDVTQTTSATGTAFFPTTADVFAAGTYDLHITKDGYDNYNSQTTIELNLLKTETITLTES